MLFAREIRVPRRPVSRVVVARLDGWDYFLTNSVQQPRMSDGRAHQDGRMPKRDGFRVYCRPSTSFLSRTPILATQDTSQPVRALLIGKALRRRLWTRRLWTFNRLLLP